MFSLFATPASLTNSLRDSGGNPLFLSPEIVGIRGSSHPETMPLFTKNISFRFDVIVWLKFKRANSLCFGLNFVFSTSWSKNHS